MNVEMAQTWVQEIANLNDELEAELTGVNTSVSNIAQDASGTLVGDLQSTANEMVQSATNLVNAFTGLVTAVGNMFAQAANLAGEIGGLLGKIGFLFGL